MQQARSPSIHRDGRLGSFKDAFTGSQTDRIQAQLISVIGDHHIFGPFSGVSRKAFGRLDPELKRRDKSI